MVLGAVASDGNKMSPYFFKANKKIGLDIYKKILQKQVSLGVKMTSSATIGEPKRVHPAKKVQKLCEDNSVCLWPDIMWPSASLNVNPLDFTIWGLLEHDTNRTPTQMLRLGSPLLYQWNEARCLKSSS